MKAIRGDDGTWSFELVGGETPMSATYEALLGRYLTCLDPAFSRAADRSEFEFILCLLRVRGLQGPGWDPYITTYSAIDSMTALHGQLKGPTNAEASRHLELWMYVHLLEASEPYELLANLIAVATGERWNGWKFPLIGKAPHLRPQSPIRKIHQIDQMARAAGLNDAAVPLREMLDSDLRNAIAHAEYSLHDYEIRILRPFPRSYQYLEVNTLVNRAHAFHQAMRILDSGYRGAYTEPQKRR